MGSTNVQVQPGDGVHVVPGCSFCVLLRQRDGDRDGFEVAGECYIEGLMKGEALEWVDEGRVKWRT